MNKKVLLIADDEEMNRKIISRFLANDFEIVQAADGKAAFDIMKSRHVDALLLDIIMPEMDGLEVLQEMRKDPKLDHIGVLVATSTKEKTERTALSIGADDIVSKPYDPVVIRKRMENIMAVKEMKSQKAVSGQSADPAVQRRIGEASETISRYADMIQANSSNPKLVEELVRELKKEAEVITKSITVGE